MADARATLTDTDRATIANARELAAVKGIAGCRERAHVEDSVAALALAWGEAQFYLTELVAIIARLAAAGEDGTDDDR